MLLDKLGVPVVLAPLAGGPSTPELTAAVAEAGGLGFLAFGYLPLDAAREQLARTRALTRHPFGVNVFVGGAGPAPPEVYATYVERLNAWAAGRGWPGGEARFSDDGFAAKVELLARDPVAVVSFTFGCPDPAVVARLRAAGSEVWVSVTSVDEAVHARAAGADTLVVQGAEAGGHRASFADDEPGMSLLALLQVVGARVELPLVAAGAVTTGRGLAAVLAAGARAAQVGTAFLLCPEAGTNPAHRTAVASAEPTALTRAFTGRLARGVRNAFMAEHDPHAPAAYPEIHYVTAPARQAARAAGDGSAINLWAGEAHELAREEPAAEVMARLMTESRAASARLATLVGGGAALR